MAINLGFEDWSLELIQMAVAISVERYSVLPDTTAVVLSYMSSNTMSDYTLNKSGVNYEKMISKNILEDRLTLENKLDTRPIVSSYFKSVENPGLVVRYLDHIYYDPIYHMKELVSGTRGTMIESVHSLKYFLSATTTLEILYSDVMKLLHRSHTVPLLSLYMDTKDFRTAFTICLRTKHGRDLSGRKNEYTEETVSALIALLKESLKKLNSYESYNYRSNNPSGYILKAFNDFIMRDRTRNGRFLSIINERSSISDVTNNLKVDDLAIDILMEDINPDEVNINFKQIATAINLASKILYTHKDQVFTDILSVAKEVILKDRFDSILEVIDKDALEMKYTELFKFFNVGDIDTLLSKYRYRVEVQRIISEYITVSGIRSENTAELISILEDMDTDPSTEKNGKRIFSWGSRNTKGRTNSYLFESLINGFISMHKFIEYLEQTGPSTGITLENFPTDIFTDSVILQQYSDINEYVNTIQHKKDINSTLPKFSPLDDFDTLDNLSVFHKITELKNEEQIKKKSKTLENSYNLDMSVIVNLLPPKQKQSVSKLSKIHVDLKRKLENEFGMFASYNANRYPNALASTKNVDPSRLSIYSSLYYRYYTAGICNPRITQLDTCYLVAKYRLQFDNTLDAILRSLESKGKVIDDNAINQYTNVLKSKLYKIGTPNSLSLTNILEIISLLNGILASFNLFIYPHDKINYADEIISSASDNFVDKLPPSLDADLNKVLMVAIGSGGSQFDAFYSEEEISTIKRLVQANLNNSYIKGLKPMSEYVEFFIDAVLSYFDITTEDKYYGYINVVKAVNAILMHFSRVYRKLHVLDKYVSNSDSPESYMYLAEFNRESDKVVISDEDNNILTPEIFKHYELKTMGYKGLGSFISLNTLESNRTIFAKVIKLISGFIPEMAEYSEYINLLSEQTLLHFNPIRPYDFKLEEILAERSHDIYIREHSNDYSENSIWNDMFKKKNLEYRTDTSGYIITKQGNRLSTREGITHNFVHSSGYYVRIDIGGNKSYLNSDVLKITNEDDINNILLTLEANSKKKGKI